MLLQRFKDESLPKGSIPTRTFLILFAAIAVITFGIYRIAAKPDKYAPGNPVDSTMLLQKQLFFQHIIDSLKTNLASNPNDTDIHVSLADALYDAGQWSESKKEFEIY